MTGFRLSQSGSRIERGEEKYDCVREPCRPDNAPKEDLQLWLSYG